MIQREYNSRRINKNTNKENDRNFKKVTMIEPTAKDVTLPNGMIVMGGDKDEQDTGRVIKVSKKGTSYGMGSNKKTKKKGLKKKGKKSKISSSRFGGRRIKK